MLKLPKCPYCGYTFDYSRSAKALRQKQIKCIKCGKKIDISYKAAAVAMAVVFFVFLVGMNTIYFFHANSKTILPNLIFTILFIIIYLSLLPLKVKMKKSAAQDEPPKKLKKNRHRHVKSKNNNQPPSTEKNPIKGTVFDK